jgi:hypothetical protein
LAAEAAELVLDQAQLQQSKQPEATAAMAETAAEAVELEVVGRLTAPEATAAMAFCIFTTKELK